MKCDEQESSFCFALEISVIVGITPLLDIPHWIESLLCLASLSIPCSCTDGAYTEMVIEEERAMDACCEMENTRTCNKYSHVIRRPVGYCVEGG